MMNGHKNVRQYSDQYHCAECKRESSAGENAIREMRKMFCKKPLHDKQ